MKFEGSFLLILFAGFVCINARHFMLKRQSSANNGDTSANCPSGWDPSPCSCKDTRSQKANVYCDNATTSEQIKTAFGRLSQNMAFESFWLKESPVISFPAEIFGKASFVNIFVSNSKLATLDDNAFKGSENTAENFLFDHTEFEVFNFNALKPLKKLRNIEISGSKLKSIPDEAFGEKPLEVVNFNDNQIETLGKNVFSQLSKLRTIDLSRNNLTSLGDFSFTTAPDVNSVTLLLGHNHISSINKDAFKNSKIKSMEFEDNKLDSLSQTIFSPIVDMITSNNGHISTLGNPFTCENNSVKWILDLPAEKRGRIIGFMCRDGRALQQLTTVSP